MVFGDFDEANCFHIESSDLYNKDLSRHGIKSVEFVLYRPERKKLLFVEGKTSLSNEKSRSSFRREIISISRKFMDSLQLACGIWLGGHSGKVKVPSNYANFFGRGVKVVFVLVIKRRKDDFDLLYIADAIKEELLREQRIWNFSVLVLNEARARDNNLIVNETVQDIDKRVPLSQVK